MIYIWQNKDWPRFTYDERRVSEAYGRFLNARDVLNSVFRSLSPASQSIFKAENIASETVSSSAIEGEDLIYESVFSSILKQLDIDFSIKAKSDKYSESVSRMVVDAITDRQMPTEERLFYWHHLLFDSVPPGRKPMIIGGYREEPVYVMHVKGKLTPEILYEAIPHERIQAEMNTFFRYLIDDNESRAIVKSAIAALWFVSIHPFQDGNGRISRAISDCVLWTSEGQKPQYFSMSSAITSDRATYYDKLQESQKSDKMDQTEWVCWYIDTAVRAMTKASQECIRKNRTANIMHSLDPSVFNSRQLQILYLLADGSFVGRLSAEKWMKMTKCGSATATRDISELVEKNILIRIGSGNRSAYYVLNPDIEHVVSHLA